jgi:hypothetical protein
VEDVKRNNDSEKEIKGKNVIQQARKLGEIKRQEKSVSVKLKLLAQVQTPMPHA